MEAVLCLFWLVKPGGQSGFVYGNFRTIRYRPFYAHKSVYNAFFRGEVQTFLHYFSILPQSDPRHHDPLKVIAIMSPEFQLLIPPDFPWIKKHDHTLKTIYQVLPDVKYGSNCYHKGQLLGKSWRLQDIAVQHSSTRTKMEPGRGVDSSTQVKRFSSPS
jgi:hypothetical protein